LIIPQGPDDHTRLPESKQYLPKEMKKLGYETAMIGKWHLVEEPAAFDHYQVLPGQGQYFDPKFIIRGENPGLKMCAV
jgi:N-acetylglucosamine-6-sulfatase